ncbi:annexin D3-like isoform X1 [Prosopis cineraria]|uniref:annexin D3-like isoform X1 n=1 Tax=Prosopis cineraria TaxID=364024 RepID=UPI00240FE33B|nr:annexin D3-like isoform X1 [Prosopis cineraria]
MSSFFPLSSGLSVNEKQTKQNKAGFSQKLYNLGFSNHQILISWKREKSLTEMSTLRVPEIVPSPTHDCERLRRAFEGFLTDGKEVIWVLGHRNARQRKEIRETYQQLFNESLIDRLHKGLSSNFRDAVILWTYDPPERDAHLANKALKDRKKDVTHLQVLVEIACASTPNHLMSVREAYCSIFDCSLEEDIASCVSQPIRKLLMSLVRSYRYDKEAVNLEIVESEASMLHGAVDSKQLDDENLIWVLSTRNFFQLRETFACYKKLYGIALEEDIKKCGNGDLESLLNVVLWCVERPEKHFAKVLRDSIIGLGTDEESLNRAVINRVEIDMLRVREEYANMYHEDLEGAIVRDTSSDYKEFLMTLLGKRI